MKIYELFEAAFFAYIEMGKKTGNESSVERLRS
jgi:hypothetical protein